MKQYKFTKEEKEYIKLMGFDFEVNKDMTDAQLFLVIDTIQDDIQINGIGDDGGENHRGYIGANVITRIVNEDKETLR